MLYLLGEHHLVALEAVVVIQLIIEEYGVESDPLRVLLGVVVLGEALVRHEEG